jgi:hypothetical protein
MREALGFALRSSPPAYGANVLSARAVASSAGKKVSSASSCSVMSTGVPNTAVVLISSHYAPRRLADALGCAHD